MNIIHMDMIINVFIIGLKLNCFYPKICNYI